MPNDNIEARHRRGTGDMDGAHYDEIGTRATPPEV